MDGLFVSLSHRLHDRAGGTRPPPNTSGYGRKRCNITRKGGYANQSLSPITGRPLTNKGKCSIWRLGSQIPSGKDRDCDDLRHSVANIAAAVLTPIRLAYWGRLAGIANRFRAKGAICEFPKCDRKSDYNSLPVDPREARFAVITSKCHNDGKYYAFIRRALLFGSIASALRYNVSARIITDLFTLIFGIPMASFSTTLDL